MTHFIKTIVTGITLLFTISNVQSQAEFTLENVTAGTGSSFCMEVTAENLTDVFAIQFSINWDPALLEFTGVNSLNSLVSGANINTTGSSSGITTFSFFGGPITVPNNEVFFELCFDVLGTNGGSTDVEFTGNPTSIEVATLTNPNIGLTTQGGQVTFPTPLIFSMPDTIQAPGAAFCLPVAVENFNNLDGFQCAISWDPAVVQFDFVTNFNLSDLNASNFGTTPAGDGLIVFSWNDEDAIANAGVTVVDGTVIFEICFTVVGNVNDNTTVVFSGSDDPFVQVEVIEFGNPNNLGLTSLGGEINIQQTIFVTNNTITQPNCNDANGGGINIAVAGGTGPYTYIWSDTNNSTTQDVNGLGVGTYTVTITDSNTPPNQFESTFVVGGNFTPPVADAGGLDTISCTEPTTVLDGTASASGTDIIYNWTHNNNTATIIGGDTNTPTVNAVGVYELLVTDISSGCTAIDQAVVNGDIVPPLVDAGDTDTLNCITTQLQLTGTVTPASTYTYQWTTIGGDIDSGDDSLTPEILQAGTYILLVNETATGCTATDTVIIASNMDTPTADAGMTMSISCGDSTVVLDGSNSTMGNDVAYQWLGIGIVADGNENTLTPTVETTGTYTLVVTNSNSQCTAESTVVVNDDFSTPVAMVSDFNPDITCTVQAVPLNGAGSSTGPNFEYEWTTVDGNVAFNPTTLNPVVDAGGEYILIVTDINNGCTATDTTVIVEDANIPIADSGPDRTLDCNTFTTQLDGSGSSLGSEFQYLWIAPTPGSFITDSTGIAPVVNAGGDYVLEVTDTISGCISISVVNVMVDTILPTIIALVPDMITCSQPEVILEGGLISIQGNNDLSFSWNTQNGSISGATAFGDLIVDGVGEYCLKVENQSNGCLDSLCIEVLENIVAPNADAGIDFALDCDQTSVMLDGSGSSSGTNFIYQWAPLSGDALTNPSTISPTITSAGEYLIIVTDTINGCMNMDTVVVTQSDDYPIAEAGANQSITCDNPTVTLDASLVSSSGAGFQIEWVGNGNITNGNTLTPSVDAPGPYFLTITNLANNCSTEDQVFVSSNNAPPNAVTAQDTLSFGCDQTTIIDGTGSTEGLNIEYFWKTTDGSILSGGDSLMVNINDGGTYSLCVINTNNGCVDTATVFVEDPVDGPTIIVDLSNNITCEFPQATLDASASTILPNQTFTWIHGPTGNIVTGQNTLTITVDEQAFYSLSVTDVASGCVFTNGALALKDTSLVEVTGITDNDIDCQTDTINLTGTVNTTSQFVSFGWTTLDGNITTVDTNQLMVQANAGGLYQFIAIDTLTGCADTAFVDVMNNTAAPIADAGPDGILDCDLTPIDLDGTGSGTGPSIEYNWTTPDGNITMGSSLPTATVNMVGTYIIEVTDLANSCSSIDTVLVTSSSDVIATAVTPVQLDCGVLSIQLDGTGSSTGATIIYEWTTTNGMIVGDANALITDVSEPGIYTLNVEDTSSGCTNSVDVEVVFDSSFPPANAGSDATICEEPFMSSANLPASTTGLWLSQGSAIPTDPSDPMSDFTNLQQGENILIWTLSAVGCPEYSSDTISIFLETAPQANDDSYTMIEGTILDFNVGVNDIFDTGQFTALTSVANGTLTPIALDNFTYTPNVDFIGTEQFDYELCSDACPDVCSIASVTITVNVAEPLPTDSLLLQNTNVITPNDDGKNDFFVFDILVQDAAEYPENEFLVFNRWGEIVYQDSPYLNDWNGTNNKGNDLPEGTYYFILRLNVADGIIIKGDVTILR